MKKFLLNAFILARISNLPTVWTNALTAWVINSTTSPSLKIMPLTSDLEFLNLGIFAYLILGASLVYTGGCTLNDAFDQNFDKVHNPERPLPSNSITIKYVWILGICELIIGILLLVMGAECEKIWVFALVISVVFYDFIHKKWTSGVLFMGLCRLFLWITAASTGGNSFITPQTWIWGIALTCYIIGISLFARGESKKQKSPSQFSILLLFGTLFVALAGLLYWNKIDSMRIFLIIVVGLLVVWITLNAIITIKKSQEGSIGKGVSRLLAGICALDAIVLAFYAPTLIAPTLCCLSIAVLLQKKFAAT